MPGVAAGARHSGRGPLDYVCYHNHVQQLCCTTMTVENGPGGPESDGEPRSEESHLPGPGQPQDPMWVWAISEFLPVFNLTLLSDAGRVVIYHLAGAASPISQRVLEEQILPLRDIQTRKLIFPRGTSTLNRVLRAMVRYHLLEPHAHQLPTGEQDRGFSLTETGQIVARPLVEIPGLPTWTSPPKPPSAA